MSETTKENQTLGQHILSRLSHFRGRNDIGEIIIFTDNFFLESRPKNPLVKGLNAEIKRMKEVGYLVFELADFKNHLDEEILEPSHLRLLYEDYLGPVMDSGMIDIVVELPRSDSTVIGKWMTERAKENGIKIIPWAKNAE